MNWVGRLLNRKGWVLADKAIYSQVKEKGTHENVTPDPGSGLFL